MNILLIEDNQNILDGLEYSLEKEGYKVGTCQTIQDSLEYLENNHPQIIILDITLPDGNGLSFFEHYLVKYHIPTIFLTARDGEEEIVKALNLGAEDYLTKPFFTKELLARINKIVLRNKKAAVIKIKDIQFDLDKMVVLKNDEPLLISPLELKLLSLLFLNINKVVTRSVILDKIWEWTGNDVDNHTVTVYFKRIREKLGTDIIKTVKGIGYRIDEEE